MTKSKDDGFREDSPRLKYINVLVDSGATSFCHYTNDTYGAKESELISLSRLKQVADFSRRRNIPCNFILGADPLPHVYRRVIDAIDHLKIVPLSAAYAYGEALAVINDRDFKKSASLKENALSHCILCLPKKKLAALGEMVASLSGKYQKLNIALQDIPLLTPADLLIYEEELEKVRALMCTEYQKGSAAEINVISDRIILTSMNNCNAGIDHVTFAPNGKFYICPGFYHDNPHGDIGTLQRGIMIKNAELLELERSPICSICDAFQCKRCVYLNKKMTGEINIPSHEQCVLSHIERALSKKLVRELKYSMKNIRAIDDIPDLEYYDPFEKLNKDTIIKKRTESRNIRNLKPLGALTLKNMPSISQKTVQSSETGGKKVNEKQILSQIYETQVEILKMLKYLRGI